MLVIVFRIHQITRYENIWHIHHHYPLQHHYLSWASCGSCFSEPTCFRRTKPKGRYVFIDWFCVSFWHWSMVFVHVWQFLFTVMWWLVAFTFYWFWIPAVDGSNPAPFHGLYLMYDPFHTPSAGGDSEGFQKKYEKAEKKQPQPGTITLTTNHQPPTLIIC